MIRIELAGKGDDAALRRLLQETPVGGAVSLGFQREPDFFLAAEVEGERHQTIVARDEHGLHGLGSRSVRTAWVNGCPQRLGYLSQLRIAAGWRGRPGWLQAGYARLRALHDQGDAPFYVTTVASDNRRARRILEAGLAGMPFYRPVDTMATLAFATRPSAEEVGPADLEEVSAFLQAIHPHYQFAPCWTPDVLEDARRCRGLSAADFLAVRRGGRLVACGAIWDQRAFKQVVLDGQVLDVGFLSHLACVSAEDGLQVVRAALGRAHARGLPLLATGLSVRHPLFAPLTATHPCMRYDSVLYTVFWDEAPVIDGRVPHLELAVL